MGFVKGHFLDFKAKKCISYTEKPEFNFCKEVNKNICYMINIIFKYEA